MAADARGDDDTLLRHGFEGLEGCHQLGQAHRDSREYHKIRQIVVPLHLFMRDPSCKDDALAETELMSQGTQVALFRAAADKQDSDVRPLPPQIG